MIKDKLLLFFILLLISCDIGKSIPHEERVSLLFEELRKTEAICNLFITENTVQLAYVVSEIFPEESYDERSILIYEDCVLALLADRLDSIGAELLELELVVGLGSEPYYFQYDSSDWSKSVRVSSKTGLRFLTQGSYSEFLEFNELINKESKELLFAEECDDDSFSWYMKILEESPLEPCEQEMCKLLLSGSLGTGNGYAKLGSELCSIDK